ncbi:hypothetical protein [Cumulibacter manganitolerans]|uniref:hypothetical protein n=1 Tax=Cumulibacter manganitolerans TaxID=1884992 RepID=UPI001886120E|nr:hypothetical protein [Cumulibacter manganitolerans]
MSTPSHDYTGGARDVVTPSPAREAAPRVLASAVGMLELTRRKRLHHPRGRVGRVIHFADGTSGRIYRETIVDEGVAADPAVLVVGFVLRGIHGRAHRAFRVESWLNTPLFVGFPGFTAKLWTAHDEHEVYRGFYEWDGADRAASYVHALSWVLGLVCVPGSIRAHITVGVHSADALAHPERLGPSGTGTEQWWRPLAPLSPR